MKKKTERQMYSSVYRYLGAGDFRVKPDFATFEAGLTQELFLD